ncbi:hypothetical protein DdX_12695 [Ditylenchus destructor]|uniref:Uncharacterized protein n=1 Tax=Ditylenchus destructor TaxID=166010 RepID=A0AAD4MVU2_9BILA|nr:hypothetical protein DdX_12695 [Ditylenchus destructor]
MKVKVVRMPPLCLLQEKHQRNAFRGKGESVKDRAMATDESSDAFAENIWPIYYLLLQKQSRDVLYICAFAETKPPAESPLFEPNSSFCNKIMANRKLVYVMGSEQRVGRSNGSCLD